MFLSMSLLISSNLSWYFGNLINLPIFGLWLRSRKNSWMWSSSFCSFWKSSVGSSPGSDAIARVRGRGFQIGEGQNKNSGDRLQSRGMVKVVGWFSGLGMDGLWWWKVDGWIISRGENKPWEARQKKKCLDRTAKLAETVNTWHRFSECNAILTFNVLYLEVHLQPNCRFIFWMFADLRNNLKRSGSSLYECSISYSTLKYSFASRISDNH